MDYYDPKFVPTPHGFYNTGSICYWNALLQSLISLPTFNRVLLANETALQKNEVAVALINYIKSVLDTNTNNITVNTNKFAKESSTVLTAIVKQLRRSRKHVDLQFGNRQESASEGFILLLEVLKSMDIERVFNNRYQLSSWCPHCNKEIMVTRDRSFQINLFYKEKPNDVEGFTKLIKQHPAPHEGYKCEDCSNVIDNGIRFHTLKMLREVVVVVFDKYLIKDMRWFPDRMQFPSTYGKPLTYKLISMIEHSGGLTGGHYWCRSYRPTSATNGKFYKFNDMNVSESNNNPDSSTYMLFYHVIDNNGNDGNDDGNDESGNDGNDGNDGKIGRAHV